MVNVNLLPWRDYRRAYHNKMFKKYCVFTSIFIIIILAIIHVMFMQAENTVKKRMQALNKKLHYQPVSVMQKVSKNNQPKNISTQLFTELGMEQKNNVCFSHIEKIQKTFFFTGKAKSMVELTEFLLRWQAAYLFKEIQIKSLDTKDNGLVQFEFHAITA